MVDTRYRLKMRRQRSYSELPEEIIFDILSRLPAKSVGLCRCVSKPWRTLLSQPNFIKVHLQLTKINSLESLAISSASSHGSVMYSAPVNKFDQSTLSLTKLSFDGYKSYEPRYELNIYGSCNGLLLLGGYQNCKFVMNPVTREIRQVLCSPLAPNRGFFKYGFGYDSVRDDYKIVIISYQCTRKNGKWVTTESFVDVYSLKTDIWKRLESPPYDYCGSGGVQGCFVDGCLHWLALRTRDNEYIIMTFNLVDEKFRDVPHSSLVLDDLLGCCTLYVFGGCLYLVTANLEIWVMKEYGVVESWTKITVDVSHGWFRLFLTGIYVSVLREFGPNKRIICNPKQYSFDEIALAGLYDNMEQGCVAASFVESLVSPRGTNDSERERKCLCVGQNFYYF